jgi:hypothetical protein
MQSYKVDLGQARKVVQDLAIKNQDLTGKIEDLVTQNEALSTQLRSVNMIQHNIVAGPVINNFINHQNDVAAPVTPAQAAESPQTLTINDDTTMFDDDGVIMPRYNSRCDLEYNGRCYRKTQCPYLHQAQINKFPAEDIDALHADRKSEHRAHGRVR